MTQQREGSHRTTIGRHDLSERQEEVLRLIAARKTNGQIAEALAITLDGAKYHVREICDRLGVDTREEAAEWWRQQQGMPPRIRTIHERWRLPATVVSAAGLAAAIAIVGGAALAVGLLLSDRQGGQTVVPGVEQDVSASDAGITITVERAEFSGTGSWLLMSVHVDGSLGEVLEVRLPVSAMEPGSLTPIEPNDGIILPVGKEVTLNLAPLQPGQDPILAMRAVELRQPDRTWRLVEGLWSLPLKLGGRPDDVLRVDFLVPGEPVREAGIIVRPVSASVSTTETLVTLEITGPDGITDMILPSIAGAHPYVYGARISQEGSLFTFSFPPIDPQVGLRVQIQEFIVAGAAGESGHVDFDLGAALERQGVEGNFADVALLEADDQSSEPAGEFKVLYVQFVQTSLSYGRRSDAINVYVDGSFEDPSGFSLQLADGAFLELRGAGTNFPLDATGNVTTGTTYLTFVFGENIDILKEGRLRLTFTEPATVIHGNWTVSFEPD